MFYVRTWQPGAHDAGNDTFLTRPTPARRDALFLERRSQSPVSLQRTPPVIELSWQLGVGGWKGVRFGRRAPCGLAGMSF